MIEHYFVVLGTIEPRKNHLLLLQVWRQLIEELGLAAPRLVIIGQRGWECEQVVDLLDRCEVLRGVVLEKTDVVMLKWRRGCSMHRRCYFHPSLKAMACLWWKRYKWVCPYWQVTCRFFGKLRGIFPNTCTRLMALVGGD